MVLFGIKMRPSKITKNLANLNKVLCYKLSIKNYMRTFHGSQVTRHHGRMRVDENANFF